jgi:leader peptidase (prepilin peptidase)/N-methyltransferase
MTNGAWVVTALTTAAASIGCAIRMYPDPAIFACCYFALAGTLMSAIDVAVIRLPDFLTLPSYPTLFVALAWASSATGEVRALHRGVEAAVVMLAVFLAQHLAVGVGLGDVKLAGLIGMLLGYFGWIVLLQGLVAGCVIGAGWAAVLHLRGRGGGYVPIGPALVAGTLIAVLT